MITVMNSRTTKTIPRKARLATACGEIAVPPSVATLVDSIRKFGCLERAELRVLGSVDVQSTIPMPIAANPTSWLRTPSAGPLVV